MSNKIPHSDSTHFGIFGREITERDWQAISKHGMPMYKVGDKLKLSAEAGSAYSGHEFCTTNIFWSDLFRSWMYYVPKYNFYQSETDLEVI